jgi:hypothetical protein
MFARLLILFYAIVSDAMLRLALLMAPLAIVDRASAACAPASPAGTSSARDVTEMPHLPPEN